MSLVLSTPFPGLCPNLEQLKARIAAKKKLLEAAEKEKCIPQMGSNMSGFGKHTLKLEGPVSRWANTTQHHQTTDQKKSPYLHQKHYILEPKFGLNT